MDTVISFAARERLYTLLDIQGKVAFAKSGIGRIEQMEQMVLDSTEEAFIAIRNAYIDSISPGGL